MTRTRVLAFPKTRRVLHELPEDFEIGENLVKWFREKIGEVPNSLVMSEHEAFLDYHRARGSRFKDWDAAWRTWMRNCVRYGTFKPRGSASRAVPRTFQAQREEEALDEFKRRHERLAGLAASTRGNGNSDVVQVGDHPRLGGPVGDAPPLPPDDRD